MKKIILIVILAVIVGATIYLLSGTTERANVNPASPNGITASSTTETATTSERVMEDGTVEPPPATPQGTPVTGELELPKEIEVNYTDNGFNPVIAIVEQGATVKFTNNSRITMWIASDPHPTHDMYKGFDAKTAVPPGAAYSFTFTRVGSWKYHNDTATSHTGTITVE